MNHDECVDGVTFFFDGQPSGWQVFYQNPPFVSQTEGPVKVFGKAFLVIRLTPAKPAPAPKDSMGNLAESIEPGQPMFVLQLRLLSASGKTITYVAGLDRKRPYRVTTSARSPRMVIKVGS